MIKKAVFPVGGMGTRFLPATKASPKEMLPVVDKHLIQYAAKEAIDALQNNEFTPAVRASNAVSRLDEILQDPNMPPYTRVKLWNVMSLIEAIKD